MSTVEYEQKVDVIPVYWQFFRGLNLDDLIIELIQNELDANASHTSISFLPDRLICQGDGEPVSEKGWERLATLFGAGEDVEAKRSGIGVKNHGLNACFGLGDDIIIRSDGVRLQKTLYRNGKDAEPSPGAYGAPVPDLEAPLFGCSVEVPYRSNTLMVTMGETFELGPTSPDLVRGLYRDACAGLPERLMGAVSPGVRNQYRLTLRHHQLGVVDIGWTAKRPTHRTGRNRKSFSLFRRECEVESHSPTTESRSVHEHVCTLRALFLDGTRPEIPGFFDPGVKDFRIEIAWSIDKKGRPQSTKGLRRYPIGYDEGFATALTGLGVHFSGPYRSDAGRHGISDRDRFNSCIDESCRDSLVDIMAGYLIPRHGGKALELYLVNGNPDSEWLPDIVRRSLNKRAIPLRGQTQNAGTKISSPKVRRRAKSGPMVPLGPRRVSAGGSRRIILPTFTWSDSEFSGLLSNICPKNEDQVSESIPAPVLRCLADIDSDGLIFTFDENDAVQRMQPLQTARWFPWASEAEWKKTLGDPEVAKRNLDVLKETIQNDKSRNASSIKPNLHLPDAKSEPRPLADLFIATVLPPSLPGRRQVPILHPSLQNHPLLQSRGWKPRQYTLDDFLDETDFHETSLNYRKQFWRWLRGSWASLSSPVRYRILTLPIWPTTTGDLVAFPALCEPKDSRVSSILRAHINRPSREIYTADMATRNGRGKFSVRRIPNIHEVRAFLSNRAVEFPKDRQLTSDEVHQFLSFEDDLAALASVSELKDSLAKLAARYAVALGGDLMLRSPAELLRSEGWVSRLYLLERHKINRPKKLLDRVEGWAPRETPTATQIADALREDGGRIDSYAPRIREYVKQSESEGTAPTGIQNLPCIPVEGELFSPSQLALKGRRDYWGLWKTVVKLSDINAETQRLYRKIGVVGGEPTETDSLRFFHWLQCQSSDVIAEHVDQILRHIKHGNGPRSWSAGNPEIAFIPVECDTNLVRLVTKSEATQNRARIAIPDHEPLEKRIRLYASDRPVGLAIVESQKVTEPITSELRALGLRTLRDAAGEPTRVVADGLDAHDPNHAFGRVILSLQTGAKGQQLRKRLDNLGLDDRRDKLRRNWRERLSVVKKVQLADSVFVTYRLFRRNFEVEESGQIDPENGTLYLRSDSDLEENFFDLVAERIFETPQKYLGPVLQRAYKLDFKERNPNYGVDESASETDYEAYEASDHAHDDGDLVETAGVHPAQIIDGSKNIPSPGPIPGGSGANSKTRIRPPATPSRSRIPTEDAQIANLKEVQYAWHCQICLATWAPSVLAPGSSYVSIPQNRQEVMHAHHCDHVNARGARHAGNILLLCRYHHMHFGDAITRSEILRSFVDMTDRIIAFASTDGKVRDVPGRLVNVKPPQLDSHVSLFFTEPHIEFWLTMASEEGVE